MEVLESVSRLAEECLHLKLNEVAEEVEDLGGSMLPGKNDINRKFEEIHGALSTLERPWTDPELLPQKVKHLLVPIVLAIGEEHDWTKPWSSTELAQKATTIAMNLFMLLTGKPIAIMETASVEEILTLDLNTEGSPRLSLFFLCLQNLRQRLKPDTWKYYPASVTAFSWLVQQVKYPHLSDYVGIVLSPCLLLVDDFNDENKLLGLKLLKHTISNVNKTELLAENWTSVLYNALTGLLHDSNPKIIELLIPLICDVLRIFEVDPNANSHKFTKYDEILKKSLFAMETGSGSDLKLVWVQRLTNVLRIMGHATLHWRDKIYDALRTLTVMCDVRLWISVVECLRVCIRNTWLKPNSTTVAEIILRIMFNCVVLEVPNTTKTDREEILRLCEEALKHLSKCSDFDKVWSQLEEMKQNPEFHTDFLNLLRNLNL